MFVQFSHSFCGTDALPMCHSNHSPVASFFSLTINAECAHGATTMPPTAGSSDDTAGLGRNGPLGEDATACMIALFDFQEANVQPPRMKEKNPW